MKKTLLILFIPFFFCCNNSDSNSNEYLDKTKEADMPKKEVLKNDTMLYKALLNYTPKTDTISDEYIHSELIKYDPVSLLKNKRIKAGLLYVLEKHYFYLVDKKGDRFDVYNIPMWSRTKTGMIIYTYLFYPEYFLKMKYDVFTDWLMIDRVVNKIDSLAKSDMDESFILPRQYGYAATKSQCGFANRT